ncbi:MAG: hypothetical protein JXA93_16070 [Anaerolineae bacterium]|nr:hypothetical protein [Anaerolineae bacterium]
MMYSKSRVRAAGRAAHWLADLDSYQVQFLILNTRHDRALIDAVRNHPAWTVDHDDGDAILFTRTKLPPHADRCPIPISSP